MQKDTNSKTQDGSLSSRRKNRDSNWEEICINIGCSNQFLFPSTIGFGVMNKATCPAISEKSRTTGIAIFVTENFDFSRIADIGTAGNLITLNFKPATLN